MENVHVKKIKSKLKKAGVSVDGIDVVYCIESAYLAEAEQLGMSNGITEPFEFVAKYPLKNGSVTFYGQIIEDRRQVGPDLEIPYYYPYVESCSLQQGHTTTTIALEVYW